MDFWTSIDNALDIIASDKPQTFDAVRDILHTHGDPEYPQPCTANKRADHAFFAGSGGDKPLRVSLNIAGWRTVWSEAPYYYVLVHPNTGELLSYIEGDVERGVSSAEAAADLESQISEGHVNATRDERGNLLAIRLS